MSFIQGNKKKIIIITILLLMGIAFLLTWLQRSVWHTNIDTNSKVYPLKFYLRDTFFYSDETKLEGSRRWEFGDGNISLADSGYYQYRRPGYYQVKLSINSNYVKLFDIHVLDTITMGRIEDSVTVIEGPGTAMQFENIVFRAHTKTAKFFSWKFGESNSVDAKEQMAIYAYQQPGDYTVSLYTDEMQYPVTQKIHVLPSYKMMNDSVSLDGMYKKIDDDFKFHLQQIANGKNFNEHYNYLLKKYLCNNENAIMKVNNSKTNNFFYYCSGLQFDKKSIIQSVKTGFDDRQNCVTKVEVVQTK